MDRTRGPDAPPRSMLVYREVEAAEHRETATMIALHGRDSSLDQLIPLATSLRPDLRVVAPQAARGVYLGLELRGRTWFGIQEPGYPEPASFGDSLVELERFVLDVLDRSAPPVLLGYDLGAVLALAGALVFPDRLSGVVAVCGYLPTIRGWSPPSIGADGLPVLLVNPLRDDDAPERLLAATAEALHERGAALTTIEEPSARDLGEEVVRHVRRWLDVSSATRPSAEPSRG
jgi:predicted esterase